MQHFSVTDVPLPYAGAVLTELLDVFELKTSRFPAMVYVRDYCINKCQTIFVPEIL